VYEGSSSFRNQAVQASDISQSKVVASGVYTQHNMDCLTSQLSNLLQPSDLRASAEDYQFSGSATSNNQPAMDLLPSGLVVSILQQIRGKTHTISLFTLGQEGMRDHAWLIKHLFY
jgi:hypothetical protein